MEASVARQTTQARSMHTVNLYKRQDIMTSSPEKCVLHVYDVAIQACAMRNGRKAGQALATLMDALNFEVGGDIASGLFRLYDYCLRLVHRNEFEQPQELLKELRSTWQTALTQHTAA